MYQRILVAVDGSNTAQAALEHALGLAREQQARLRILHVVDAVVYNWDREYLNPLDVRDILMKTGQEILARAQEHARTAGIAAETKLSEVHTLGHRVPDAIAEEARDWPADLIVIGTHGRRGLNRFLLGSVADGVVHLSPSPVLLIRGTA